MVVVEVEVGVEVVVVVGVEVVVVVGVEVGVVVGVEVGVEVEVEVVRHMSSPTLPDLIAGYRVPGLPFSKRAAVRTIVSDRLRLRRTGKGSKAKRRAKALSP